MTSQASPEPSCIRVQPAKSDALATARTRSVAYRRCRQKCQARARGRSASAQERVAHASAASHAPLVMAERACTSSTTAARNTSRTAGRSHPHRPHDAPPPFTVASCLPLAGQTIGRSILEVVDQIRQGIVGVGVSKATSAVAATVVRERLFMLPRVQGCCGGPRSTRAPTVGSCKTTGLQGCGQLVHALR